MGTPDLGTASAGRAAMALDASTAFGNPAGMTKLERSQFLGSFQLILPSMYFNVEPGTTFGRLGETGNAGIPLPSAAGFYVHKVSPNWRLGVSLSSYLGLGQLRGHLGRALLPASRQAFYRGLDAYRGL